MKRRNTSLILCIFGGPFGIHKFYEKDYLNGVIYLCTAGMFFIWWIRDIFIYASMKEEEYNPKEIAREKKEKKQIKREKIINEREKIKTKKREKLRNRTCPRCGGKNFHAFVEEVEIVSGKTKTRYTANLNPLRPFTFVNKKEKVIRKPITKSVSKFVCDDCGKIFL